MAKASLPPGFRFHPTDVELVKYYLKRKVMGKPLRFKVISVIDLYKFSPWDLPAKSCLRSRDLEWHFFCPRDKKYTNGPRTNRATERGYWKTTGKDRPVCHNSQTVGMKKTLVFHIGRAPRGERTNWVMHEYRLTDKELVDRGISEDAYVLCKVFEKSGPGPKNGEQHGAPFIEEEWEEDADSDDMRNSSFVTFDNPTSSPRPADCQNHVAVENHSSSPDFFDVEELLQELCENENGALVSLGNGINEKLDALVSPSNHAQDGFTPDGDDEIYSGLEDIANQEQCGDLCSHNSLDYDYGIDQMPLGMNDGDIIELNDFNPLLPSSPEYGIPINLWDSRDTLNVPVFEVDNNGCNFDYTTPVQKVDEIGNTCDQQSFMGGEQHTVSPTLEPISGEGGSYSKLKYLLDSIPAPPASAAEYSPPKGEDLKSNLISYNSSIHVKAEVTVRCMCTGGLLSDQLGTRPCACCYGGNPCKKLGSEPSSRGGGFMFVFLLGMVSALMWVFLLAISAKFGRYAWKNFIRPS